ncbi:hypothetical protein BN946_scf185028.g6 [Trametes cinnabarina]|uniref:LIM zinc-binding domain-containing protein n=1 Tax=Pycnoporus cinnabarinus TaxID=5643 RepID=A0A060SQV6_PYCCI|nr:hypothetical protein BN946_scf185028.g6 [Trametes cinnabarina]
MHPFGGTPICPRCSKAVYAAEQIMGPGRKPCLSCMNCGKRLDSFSLVEHNEEPYCKNCHVKLFGTRDLRHANLPHRDEILGSPPASPVRPNTFAFNRAASPPPLGSRADSSGNNGNGTAPPLPVRRHLTGAAGLDRTTSPPPTLLKPTRTLSPGRDHQRSRPTSFAQVTEQMHALRDLVEDQPEPEPEKQDTRDEKEEEKEEKDWQPPATPPHVKAVGKTWHKGCLRCAECGHTLDSGRLSEKDGEPFCQRCYAKVSARALSCRSPRRETGG